MLGLAKAIRALAKVPSRVTTTFAGWITEELKRNYAAEVNAYGAAQPALLPSTVVRKAGNTDILRRGGNMAAGTRAEPRAGAGIDLITDEAYMKWHHGGTKHMISRPVFPNAGMPAKWTAELAKIFAKEIEK